MAGQSYAGEWWDATNDCKVWNSNPNPHPTTTAKWVGACLNGFADGVGELYWYTKEGTDIHKGYMKRGMVYGKGIYTWENGSRYEGEFKYSSREGFGSLKLSKSNEVGIRSWRNANQGKWQGDYYVIEGVFKNGDLERECALKDCDPNYDPYEGFDEKTKNDIVMSKITTAIKEERYRDALPHFAYLEKINKNLPESFYFYQIQSLSKAGRSEDATNKAKDYLKRYGSNSKYYAEVIEILGR